jgi:hypothetical protein
MAQTWTETGHPGKPQKGEVSLSAPATLGSTLGQRPFLAPLVGITLILGVN